MSQFADLWEEKLNSLSEGMFHRIIKFLTDHPEQIERVATLTITSTNELELMDQINELEKNVGQSDDENQPITLALPVKGAFIDQHFGHSQAFKIYEIGADGKIEKSFVVENQGGHEKAVELLIANAVDGVICGNIGEGAKNGLLEAGIVYFGGVIGNADKAVTDFLSGKLNFAFSSLDEQDEDIETCPNGCSEGCSDGCSSCSGCGHRKN